MLNGHSGRNRNVGSTGDTPEVPVGLLVGAGSCGAVVAGAGGAADGCGAGVLPFREPISAEAVTPPANTGSAGVSMVVLMAPSFVPGSASCAGVAR